MNILGIETSCDETAAAVIKNGKDILSNVVVSSLKEHKKYGGIIPEIASRRQLECINSVVEQAVDQAKLKLNDVDAIAVTHEPGLIGSLLVGISFAQSLSYALNKPLLKVNHIQAHMYANFLQAKGEQKTLPKLPAIGLVVSGGHTSLFHVKSFQDIKEIGQTRDDAVGEAYDKVARIFDLSYPGGPVIDRLAQKGQKSDIQFTCAALPGTLDFSFSGIKTAVLYYKRDNKDYSIENVAYAFQNSAVKILVKKSIEACKKYKSKTLLVGGGVAANSALRAALIQAGEEEGIEIFYPPIALCLDNAAMIAGLAYHQK